MRIWKKINKGVVATILVLAVLITYLCMVEVDRKEQKGKISEACTAYLQTIDKVLAIPEQDRNQIDTYIETVKTTLQPYMVEKEEVLETQMKWITSVIEQQKESKEYIQKQTNEIKRFEEYRFDGDQVKVSITGKQSKETVDAQGEVHVSSPTDTSNEIILKKEGDTWKVVYANLSGVTLDIQANTMKFYY